MQKYDAGKIAGDVVAIRFVFFAGQDLALNWQAGLSAIGIDIDRRTTRFDTTALLVTGGPTHLLLEMALTRPTMTIMACPTRDELALIDRLVQKGVAGYALSVCPVLSVS